MDFYGYIVFHIFFSNPSLIIDNIVLPIVTTAEY